MMSGYHSFAQAYDALIAQQIDYSAMAKRICQLISNYKGTRSLVWIWPAAAVPLPWN